MHMRTCRRRGCTANVEIEVEDYWSDQCAWHNEADRDERREYREDELRYRDEMESGDADD